MSFGHLVLHVNHLVLYVSHLVEYVSHLVKYVDNVVLHVNHLTVHNIACEPIGTVGKLFGSVWDCIFAMLYYI